MFKRKIYDDLLKWKLGKKDKIFMLKGARQTGKTTIITNFVKENYQNYIYIDFRKQRELWDCFSGDFDVDKILMQLSAKIRNVQFIPYETALIFDEIQDCQDARSSLKYFALDKRYDIYATGSLLGIKGYSKVPSRGISVGFEEHHEMKPFDFEEFLWALDIPKSIISHITDCYNNLQPILTGIHSEMQKLFHQYICVGGMPAAVVKFVETKNFNEVYRVQRDILATYEADFGVHLDENGKEYINQKEFARILSCYRSIPNQLAKENKKFQYNLLEKKGRKADYIDALEWLLDAGIISKCYNLSITELPLSGNKIDDVFKVYMQDTGLFISMLEEGTVSDILNGNLLTYKGAIYENIVADAFIKNHKELYYFHKDSGLEIDFVMRYKGKCTLIEVKSKGGKAKSLKTILEDYNRYHVDSAIKLTSNNVSVHDNVIHLPYYMAFLITQV